MQLILLGSGFGLIFPVLMFRKYILLIYLFTATFCELEYQSQLVVFTFSHNLHSGDQKEARNSSRKFRQGGMRLPG